MIVAYALSGHNNGAHFFYEAPETFFCPSCSSIIDQSYIAKRLLHLNKKLNDFTYTYDGRAIVTEQFKVFSEQLCPKDLIFKKVNLNPELFLINTTKELVFDSKRRKTLFEDYCQTCKQYAQVAGATPGFLKDIEKPILSGFFHTNVEFGSFKEKNTMILVGIETMKELTKKKLTGLEFKPIYGVGEKVTINGIIL
jgi:hypothetical protein